MARLVDGLDTLRGEFNLINPQRDRTSDGWIGDDRHAASISDHNVDDLGFVRAVDVDVDGVPMARCVAWLVSECRTGRETRLQYVIYRRTIWSRSWGWKARAYHGANPHTRHAHFSARRDAVAGDGRPWGLAEKFAAAGRKPAAPSKAASKPRPSGPHRPGTRRLDVAEPVLSGVDVEFVQDWIGVERAGRPDGRYGPKTAAGVRWYQGQRGIERDGVVGPQTWRHMGVRWTGGST